jgi:hypothetical protein
LPAAVGYAEADQTQDFFMAVGVVGGDNIAKERTKACVVTHGTLDQAAEDFRDTKVLTGFFTINVSDIIRRLRARAGRQNQS